MRLEHTRKPRSLESRKQGAFLNLISSHSSDVRLRITGRLTEKTGGLFVDLEVLTNLKTKGLEQIAKLWAHPNEGPPRQRDSRTTFRLGVIAGASNHVAQER